MYLTASSLVPYLLQKGILSTSALLNRDWSILQNDSRRPVLRVTSANGRGWIVKQPSPLDEPHVAMLDREAAFFQLTDEVLWARPLRPLMPRFRFYDPGVHVLIVEFLPHDTAADYLRRQNTRSQTLGRLLGKALAKVHIGMRPSRSHANFISGRLPWVLQIESSNSAGSGQAATEQLLALIRGDRQLTGALTRLRREWRQNVLIHGDAKLDNILVRGGPQPRAWLVDWAFAGFGDPAWDVGTVVHSCLLLWQHGITFTRDQSVDVSLGQATLPLARFQAFTKEFLSTYSRTMNMAEDERAAFRRRVSLFAGAALIQSAVSMARVQKQVSSRQFATLQMGSHFLSDPLALSRFLE